MKLRKKESIIRDYLVLFHGFCNFYVRQECEEFQESLYVCVCEVQEILK